MNTTNPKDFMASPFLDTPATMEKNVRERQLQDDGENQNMNWNTKGTRKKKSKRNKFTPKVIREGTSIRKLKKTPTKRKENGSVKRKENSSVKRKHASMENTRIPTVKRRLRLGDDQEQDNLNETPVAMSTGIQSSNDQCNDLKENSLLGKFVHIRKPRSQILRRKLRFGDDKKWLDSNGTPCLTSRGTKRNLADQRWFLPYLLFIHKKKRKKTVREETTSGWKGISLLQNVSGAFTIAKIEVSKFVKMPDEVEGEKHDKLVQDHNSVAADCHNFSTSTIEPSTPEKVSKCSINQEDDICGLQALNEAEKEIDRRLDLSHRSSSSSSGPIFYRRRVSTHIKINMDSNQPSIPEKVSGCRNNQENKICWHQDLEGKLGFNRENVNNKVVQANRSNSCYIVYSRKHSTPINPSYQSNATFETPIRESESKCNNNWENEVQPQASECVFVCKEKEKGDGFVQANSSASSTFIEDCDKPISSENSMVFVQAEKTNNMPIQAHCPHSCSSQPLAFEKPLGCSNKRGNRSYGPQARIELLILKSRGKRHGRKRRAPSINSMAPISDNMVDVHRGRKITDLQIIPVHGSWSSRNNHKGSAFPSLESRNPILSNLDYIIHKLRHLNVNSVHEGDANHLENALVPFARGGTIVDVKSLYDLVKKKKLKAKVDLDPESNRMWELLMGNERADGETDENKEKWWEEERRVFYGRVDSFIAQMERILGDRQFSPWKGSVVDSVVGVFLTQNVSDHLSSSAFMSLAARFPLHAKGNKKTANVETMSRPIIVDESSSSSEPASCSDSHPPNQNSDEPITLSTLEDRAKRYACCQREVCICDPQDGKTTIYWRREIEVEHQVERTFHAIETQTQNQTCDVQICLNTENVNIEASLNSAEPESNLRSETCTSQQGSAKILNNTSKDEKANAESDKEAHDWDRLRREAFQNGAKKEQNNYTMDSLDYEAVRCADNSEVACAIRERGQNNNLAMRIKDFLNRIVKDHGSIDLEWLRDIPPERAKDFLLSIDGLGIKSVECVRLLSLHHQAFPVDTNVGRICVRLGWVPLQPLPDSLQMHLLEMYPIQETVQKYLWPRLCKLDHETLYKLHYLLIAFGKVFCTKSKPNCNACPMRGGCKHFASAFASTRLGLPRPEETSSASAAIPNQNPTILPVLEGSTISQYQPTPRNCEPIIELPASPEPTEEFASPELDREETVENDIEDFLRDDPDGIPAIYLNAEEFNQNILNYIQETNMELQEGDWSKALVSLTPQVASIPMPKLKNVSRLRTTHQVYELEDSSPLLEGLEKRDPDDHSPYLLAIWTPGETTQSIEPPKACYNSQDGKMCDNNMCFSCNNMREAQAGTVRGTLLIPCRTANRGSFPLNGTYFQVNEVFADHYTSHNPIVVPRNWIWSLRRSTVFFGTSVSAMLKGLTTEEVQRCFWRGYVCVRAFDRETRIAKPLCPRFHSSTTMTAKIKGQNQQRGRRSTPMPQKKATGMNMDDKQTN